MNAGVEAGVSPARARPFTSYQEALAWLYGTQLFGIKLGLESVRRLFAALNLFAPAGSGDLDVADSAATAKNLAAPKAFGPGSKEIGDLETAAPWGLNVSSQRGIVWHPQIIHVAGTNGKGSVCAMIDSILRAQGYRTGLFTSPHLVSFRERIQINGEEISEQDVVAGLTTIRDLVANWEPHPTFFEIVTALALLHFRQREIEFVILETGMGGRLDATNATQPIVSVITPIHLDHQKWLGNSLATIAGEKAGIIKAKVPVVSAMQLPDAEKIIRARAAECDAPLEFVGTSYAGSIGLAGEHQKQNASLAVAALRASEIIIEETALELGLATVQWPARFQQWDERTFIDGAHNPSGAQTLTKTWNAMFAQQRVTIVLAVLKDKDIAGILRALSPIAQRFILPRIQSVRAVRPETLAQIVADISPSLPCDITPSVATGLELARRATDPILITGSLHFAGEALAYLQGVPASYEECAQ